MVGKALMRLSEKSTCQAEELGCEMAKDDGALKPDLNHARCHEDYGRFQNAHREQLERTDEFIQVWQERLFTIAEEEAKPWGLRMDDSIQSWDVWYHQIVVPLKNLLWEAWEDHCNLPTLYAKARPKTESVETAGDRGMSPRAAASRPKTEGVEMIPSSPLWAVHRYLSLLDQIEASTLADETDAALWQPR